MDLSDVLRTTGAVRDFTSEPVDDAVLFAILDDARFAPSGGNRQSWHVIVVKDERQRRSIGAAYLDAWHDYVAHLLAGVIPFSPLASEADRLAAASQRGAAEKLSKPDGFAETFADVPVMLVVSADLSVLAAIDRDLDRYQVVGGASIYPFVWSILLAARERGVGGVMTTMAVRNEPELKEILDLPENHAVAAIVALGHHERRHTQLKRREVAEFTTVDRFDGPSFYA
ncbi:MAG TPA: nitroreductase family protein [Acidimicrobiales bacterium]|nr:nitroreductase family protein [Acidimicrobiales bacterium]